MRIVGGKFKGTKLETPKDKNIRPTADRLRETLFSILEFPKWREPRKSLIKDAIILDGYCGTGALGLEAWSRGAKSIFFIDNSNESLSLARRNMQKMPTNQKGICSFKKTDLSKQITPTKTTATLIFLDPPYKNNLEIKTIIELQKSGWIDNKTHIIIEMDKSDTANISSNLPQDFKIKDSRTIGKSHILIIQHNHN